MAIHRRRLNNHVSISRSSTQIQLLHMQTGNTNDDKMNASHTYMMASEYVHVVIRRMDAMHS